MRQPPDATPTAAPFKSSTTTQLLQSNSRALLSFKRGRPKKRRRGPRSTRASGSRSWRAVIAHSVCAISSSEVINSLHRTSQFVVRLCWDCRPRHEADPPVGRTTLVQSFSRTMRTPNFCGPIARAEDEPDPSSVLLPGGRAARIGRRAKNLGGLSRKVGDIVRSSPLGSSVLANTIAHRGGAPARAEGCARARDVLPFTFDLECVAQAATKTCPDFFSLMLKCTFLIANQ
jgi:hypothetical protein